MKIAVILENTGGELDRAIVDASALDDDAIDDAVSAVIESWRFAVGDTIKIRELRQSPCEAAPSWRPDDPTSVPA